MPFQRSPKLESKIELQLAKDMKPLWNGGESARQIARTLHFGEPTIFVDISEIIELKTEAISEYESQMKKTDDYYLLFNLQKARLRGLQGSCEYAEAFREVLIPVHGPFYNPSPTVKTIF